jgi:hypothetical protein
MLDLTDNDSIVTADTPPAPLGGSGAGNGSFTGGEVYTLDREAPDTTITSGPSSNSNSLSLSFSGSDGNGSGVAGFACQLDGGSFAACASPASLTALSEGSHSFQVYATDAVGNADPTPASLIWAVDTGAPALTLAQPGIINLANQASYPVSGSCAAGDGAVTVQVGSLSGSAACIGDSFSLSLNVSALADGSGITVSASQTDATGNTGRASATTSKDAVAPTVSISSPANNPTSVIPIPFAVSFSESVTGFAVTDLTVTNATVSNFVGSAASYSFDLTPSGQGAVTVAVAAGVVSDAAGNPNAAASLSRSYAPAAPTGSVVYLPVVLVPAPPPALPDLGVEQISTAGGQLAVTIRNQGGGPVADAFWVDLAVAPRR